jgi:hypothetical protein
MSHFLVHQIGQKMTLLATDRRFDVEWAEWLSCTDIGFEAPREFASLKLGRPAKLEVVSRVQH